jgi:hypothetical protein
VLDDMEAEHLLIDLALEALERGFDDRATDPDEVAGRIDHIVSLLQSHLAHEERDAGPLIREVITSQEWAVLHRTPMK